MHESEDTKLVAMLVREYLEFYKMDYTMSVYLPEISMQNTEPQAREELANIAKLPSQREMPKEQQEPLLV